MALLGRLAYTQFTRRKGPELSFASTAETSVNGVVGFNTEHMALHSVSDAEDKEHESGPDNKELHVVENEMVSESASDPIFLSANALPHASIAIFPQYLTQALTTLIIREWSVPHFSESFSVHVAAVGGQSAPIFNIERDIPSFKHRQKVTDATTGRAIMNINRNIGQLPRSYNFEDPTGAKILELQGDFFVPFTGAKSRALFRNAASPQDGGNVELCMQGSYKNTKAEIKSKTGSGGDQTVATVRCNLWNKRFLAGGRRTYVVSVRAGVDLAVIAGMVTALDARSD